MMLLLMKEDTWFYMKYAFAVGLMKTFAFFIAMIFIVL